MRSSALLSSRIGGATTPVNRCPTAAAAARQEAAMLRLQRRRRRRPQHSTSTPAIWDRWGSSKKPGEGKPASADASTETDASLVDAVGERWETRERGRGARNKREETARRKHADDAENQNSTFETHTLQVPTPASRRWLLLRRESPQQQQQPRLLSRQRTAAGAAKRRRQGSQQQTSRRRLLNLLDLLLLRLLRGTTPPLRAPRQTPSAPSSCSSSLRARSGPASD